MLYAYKSKSKLNINKNDGSYLTKESYNEILEKIEY